MDDCTQRPLKLFFFLFKFLGVELYSPLGTLATNWPIVPVLVLDDDECGAVTGMRIGRGN